MSTNTSHLPPRNIHFLDGNVSLCLTDVKPENVMISVDSAVLAGERTKVLDFGIAVVPKNELSTSQQPFLPHSDPGQFAGTIPYMAPEQLDCQGHGPITPKTDVYQLGVLMYELLSGQTPFAYTGMHGLSLVMCIVQQDPRPLTALAPDVPDDLAYLILRMLAKSEVALASERFNRALPTRSRFYSEYLR